MRRKGKNEKDGTDWTKGCRRRQRSRGHASCSLHSIDDDVFPNRLGQPSKSTQTSQLSQACRERHQQRENTPSTRTRLHRHISPWGVVRDATSSPHQHSIRLATPFILHSIPEKTSVASLPFPTPYPFMETTPGASRLSFKGAMLDTSNGTELTDFLCCDEKNGPAGKP